MAKYVPPHLRARQAAEAAAAAAGEAPASKPAWDDADDRRDDRRMRNGFDNGGYGGRDRDDGGGRKGGGKGGGDRWGDRENQGGNSRFDCLKDDFGGGRSGGGFGRGGNNGDYRRSDYDRSDNGGGGGGGDWFHRRDGRRNNGWDTPSERAVFGEQRATTGINFDDYDKIPVKVSGRSECEYEALESYNQAGLQRSLSANLQRCGYERPTPVQKHAIPIVCGGRDVMACAQTGSGKTCAYMVPAIEMLLRWGPPPMPPTSRRTPAPCALVLAPTRELATQIFEEGRKFAYNTGVRCTVVYGGADVRDQRRELNNGCDVLVATPGRLTDMFDRGLVTLSLIQFLILDEADRMLDMGFEPQVRQIVEKTDMGEHAPRDRQSMMFSATFAREVQRMASDFLHDYIFLTIGRVGSASELVEQSVVHAEERDKARLLEDILRDERPEKGLALVFVETKRGADTLERDLWQSGLPVTAIHGDRSQHEREEALSAFRRGANPILIATDVAARGLDIPNVHLVINYDMAKQIDDYVHRIGRTGRAGRSGKAIAFINDKTGNSLLRDLRDILEEGDHEVPDWFEGLCRSYRGGGGGGRKGGGKGNRNKHSFGGRDARFESDWRGGGGGGGGGGHRGGDRGGGSRRNDDW